MLEIPGFTYSACGPFTKNKYIYQNELDKAYFQHDMAYGDFKDLPEELLVIKYYTINLLMLLKFQNMMNIKEILLI